MAVLSRDRAVFGLDGPAARAVVPGLAVYGSAFGGGG